MLLELAVGDAYGAGFEYVDAAMIARHNDLTHYVTHPRHAILPGCYTDDTQMSIAVTEALVSGEPWSRELLAERFVAAFKRDPREGYAGRFYQFLQEAPDGRAFLARIRPDSDKSGAAMRAAPIGVLPTVPEVIARCTLQARITHDTVDGVNAAVAAALSAHYLLYDLGPKARLGDFLSQHVPGEWARPWHGKVGSKGLMSARAAVTALMRCDGMRQLLQMCVDFTGDVDTVAAIALAAGACSREIAQDLPENLTVTLENRAYGRDYLIALDRQLLALAEPPA